MEESFNNSEVSDKDTATKNLGYAQISLASFINQKIEAQQRGEDTSAIDANINAAQEAVKRAQDRLGRN